MFTLLGLSITCVHPSQESPVTPPHPITPEMRLQCSENRGLYLVNAPAGYGLGSFFYVLTHDPLPHTVNDRPRISLVRALRREGMGSSLPVTAYCPLDVRQVVPDGLPAVAVVEDALLRVAKCVGRFRGQDEARWSEGLGWADLLLDLGDVDGVQPGDVYEVLGAPISDEINHVVIDFEKLGECAIQQYTSTIAQTMCRLDRVQWPRFGREAWIRGGSVHRKPGDVAPGRPCSSVQPGDPP